MADLISSRDKLIDFVERLEYDADKVSCTFNRNPPDRDYYGKLEFYYDDFRIEVSFYVNQDKPSQNSAIGVKFNSHDGHREVFLSSVSDSLAVFSPAFHKKVAVWASEAMGLNEPDDDEDWFVSKIGVVS